MDVHTGHIATQIVIDVRDNRRITDMPTTALAIFSRSPVPGQTKKRLQQRLTASECALFHRACLADLNELAGRINMPSFLYYTGFLTGFQEDYGEQIPPGFEEIRLLRLDNLEFRRQRGDDLGERMQQAVAEILQEYDQVLLAGSDLPDLTEVILDEALGGLADNDLAIGPSDDGGYCLLGLKKLDHSLFTGIEWGTEQVLEQTLLAAERAQLRVALLRPMRDVDTWSDLNAYADRADDCISGRLARILAQKYRNAG
jgi:rSAM/selenodomain-associated transferase 1